MHGPATVLVTGVGSFNHLMLEEMRSSGQPSRFSLRNGRCGITIAWCWLFTGAVHSQVLSVDSDNDVILAESPQVSGPPCEYVLPPKAGGWVGAFLRQHRDTGRPIALRWGDVISSIMGRKKKDVFFYTLPGGGDGGLYNGRQSGDIGPVHRPLTIPISTVGTPMILDPLPDLCLSSRISLTRSTIQKPTAH